MLNAFSVKKYIAFIIASVIPSLTLTTCLIFYDKKTTLVAFPIVLIFSYIAYTLLLRNPFSVMLEGKGNLVANMDSTGRYYFFNVKVLPPLVKGKNNGLEIQDVWDRNTVSAMVPPQKNQGYCYQDKKGDWILKIRNEEYNRAKMAYGQYSLLIWNDQIQSLVTKDFLSDIESSSFANHPILNLNHLVKDLGFNTRNFARMVVDQLKPSEGLFKGKLGIIIVVIIIVFVIIAIIIAAPSIMDSLRGGTQEAVSSAAQSMGGAMQTITPK